MDLLKMYRPRFFAVLIAISWQFYTFLEIIINEKHGFTVNMSRNIIIVGLVYC